MFLCAVYTQQYTTALITRINVRLPNLESNVVQLDPVFSRRRENAPVKLPLTQHQLSLSPTLISEIL